MLEIIPVHTDVMRAALQHRLDDSNFVHCNLQAEDCCCTQGDMHKGSERGQTIVTRPPNSGNACHNCGGMMVRTGTCETCTECGSTGGCG